MFQHWKQNCVLSFCFSGLQNMDNYVDFVDLQRLNKSQAKHSGLLLPKSSAHYEPSIVPATCSSYYLIYFSSNSLYYCYYSFYTQGVCILRRSSHLLKVTNQVFYSDILARFHYMVSLTNTCLMVCIHLRTSHANQHDDI